MGLSVALSCYSVLYAGAGHPLYPGWIAVSMALFGAVLGFVGVYLFLGALSKGVVSFDKGIIVFILVFVLSTVLLPLYFTGILKGMLLVYLAHFIAGILLAWIFLVSCLLVTKAGRGRFIELLPFAVVASGVLYIAYLLLDSVWLVCLIAVLIMACIVCMMLTRTFILQAFEIDITKIESPKRLYIGSVSTFAMGLVFGFAIYAEPQFFRGVSHEPWLIIVSIATMILASLFFLRFFATHSVRNLPVWSYFFLMTLVFVAAGIIDVPAFRVAAYLVIGILFLSQSVTDLYIEMHYIRVRGLCFARCLAFNRCGEVLGVFLGILIMHLVEIAIGGSVSISTLAVIVCLCLVGMMAGMFRWFMNSTWEKNPVEARARFLQPVSWEVACREISDRYGLSPREFDVFLLLSRGHSAKHIEESLVVSNATVKSHTYRIYSKLGIHSQEELIEMVEDYCGMHASDFVRASGPEA